MGSCVSRRKPSSGGCVQKEPSQNFEKIPSKNEICHEISTIQHDRSVLNVTPIDAKNVIKFFPIDLFPAETLALLNGKCDAVENECKKEIKLYVSATFAGNLILLESFFFFYTENT
jgi:hypothetical protein